MLPLTLQADTLIFVTLSEWTETTTFTFAFDGGYGFGFTPISHPSTGDCSNLWEREGEGI